jgi:hypothetical protein
VLIAPAPEGLLEAYPVSTDVNRVANDNPKLLDLFVPGAEPEHASTPKATAKAAPAKRVKVKKTSGQGALF